MESGLQTNYLPGAVLLAVGICQAVSALALSSWIAPRAAILHGITSAAILALPMKITWNELTIAPSTHSPDDLLSAWRWLLGDAYQIVLISSLGDIFLADATGRIHWLDAGAGRLTEVASSVDEFQQLRQKPENVAEWFIPQLVGDIMESGARLAHGRCFGYKVPPVLGGQMEPVNFEPTDLSVHFGILSQIHEKVKDLPVGTPISGLEFR